MTFMEPGTIGGPHAGQVLGATGGCAVRERGLGRIYQAPYTNPKTGNKGRTRIWYIALRFRGRTIRESSHSHNRADAVRLLRRRLGEIGQGRYIPDVEKTTYADLEQMFINDYIVNSRKSLKRARIAAKRLRAFFGGMRAVEITADRIDEYKRVRLESNIARRPGATRHPKPATVNNELAALKRMFTLGIRAEKVARRPYIQVLEARNTRTGFFEEPEFRAVRDQLHEDVKPLVEFAYLTGWRIGEILPLQWKQVDFRAGTIRLEPGTTKNDEGRVFPFKALPALDALLRRQRERTEAVSRARDEVVPWVFHRDGTPIKTFRTAWRRACSAAGLAGRIPHDFRRTAVRNLERAGVPRSVAMKLTGHKTESIYRRYAIVSEADLSGGVGKLAVLHERDAHSTRTIVPLTAGRA